MLQSDAMEAFHRVIPISSLSAVSTVKASITDVKYLTSYTWDKTENVTPISIEVPGMGCRGLPNLPLPG